MARNGYTRDQDVHMLSVLADATTSHAAVQDWRGAIRNGLAVAARSVKSSFPECLLALDEDPSQNHRRRCFPHVPADAGVERRLATAAPRILDGSGRGDPGIARLVSRLASSPRYRLVGQCLSVECRCAGRSRSIPILLSFEGLRAALRNAKPAELVGCALQIEDPRMPRLAGEAVAKDPTLLAGLDLTPTPAQAIWREALAIEPESWQGPTDPMASFHSVLRPPPGNR